MRSASSLATTRKDLSLSRARGSIRRCFDKISKDSYKVCLPSLSCDDAGGLTNPRLKLPAYPLLDSILLLRHDSCASSSGTSEASTRPVPCSHSSPCHAVLPNKQTCLQDCRPLAADHQDPWQCLIGGKSFSRQSAEAIPDPTMFHVTLFPLPPRDSPPAESMSQVCPAVMPRRRFNFPPNIKSPACICRAACWGGGMSIPHTQVAG